MIYGLFACGSSMLAVAVSTAIGAKHPEKAQTCGWVGTAFLFVFVFSFGNTYVTSSMVLRRLKLLLTSLQMVHVQLAVWSGNIILAHAKQRSRSHECRLLDLQYVDPFDVLQTKSKHLCIDFAIVFSVPQGFDSLGYKFYLIWVCIMAVSIPVIYFTYVETCGRTLECVTWICVMSGDNLLTQLEHNCCLQTTRRLLRYSQRMESKSPERQRCSPSSASNQKRELERREKRRRQLREGLRVVQCLQDGFSACGNDSRLKFVTATRQRWISLLYRSPLVDSRYTKS
jgi:hypothetical protein